jgi:hypothetical protein
MSQHLQNPDFIGRSEIEKCQFFSGFFIRQWTFSLADHWRMQCSTVGSADNESALRKKDGGRLRLPPSAIAFFHWQQRRTAILFSPRRFQAQWQLRPHGCIAKARKESRS